MIFALQNLARKYQTALRTRTITVYREKMNEIEEQFFLRRLVVLAEQ